MQHTVRDSGLARFHLDMPAPALEAAVERMLLNEQPDMFGRTAGKTVQHIVDRLGHIVERRMLADLEVVGELQRKQEIGLAFEACHDIIRSCGLRLLSREFVEPAEPLANQRSLPMRGVEREKRAC